MLISRTLSMLVNLAFAIIGFLLGLRIILRFFGANPTTPFVQWIYESSDSLLAPFVGVFPSTRIEGGFIIDFPSVFALIIYTFLGYLIIEIVEIIMLRSDERVGRKRS